MSKLKTNLPIKSQSESARNNSTSKDSSGIHNDKKASPQEQARKWLQSAQNCFDNQDIDGFVDLFDDNGYWRDMLTIELDFNSLKKHKIKPYFNQLKLTLPSLRNLSLDRPAEIKCAEDSLQAFIKFDTEHYRGTGFLQLKNWKISSLPLASIFFTQVDEVKGHEEKLGQRRPLGTTHGSYCQPPQLNWLQRRQQKTESYKHGIHPTVLIIGGGQNGLMLAARLKLLGIDCLIIEKTKRLGDCWRLRYHSLCLHDPVWADHFPYIPYPSSWPIYTPKDKLANWFEHYAEAMELDVWLETTISPGSKYHPESGNWEVSIKFSDDVPLLKLQPRYLVMATGLSGEPNWPTNFSMDAFNGTILHSSQFGFGKEWCDKRAVVIGACNSGHDIAADLWQNGAKEVTMVQRSSTYVISSQKGLPTLLKGSYEEGGLSTEDADLILKGLPLDVLETAHIQLTKEVTKLDRDLLDGLKKAGFCLDPIPAGLFLKYFRRGGGYYIDVGCSQLIVDRKIKLKQGKDIVGLTADSVRFEDGEEIKADLVVCATGYRSMKETVRKVISEEVANKLGPIWGKDSQGEIPGAWRLCGQAGLWLMCGNLCYSKTVALQIQLQELKIYDKNWIGRAQEKLDNSLEKPYE
ncbi:hypothetical protein O181_053132 [Austropuccinia psidii MF-1]|uniref:FAD/NAD(P)-binding domain-containing protein n=1 Tax=Austropuccinia psidii MF-1 TaxID=1389203 RepID=A0A9Q3HR78_9BASI|nr:hypothetical protein [Austropuccinia psidii MF-1]